MRRQLLTAVGMVIVMTLRLRIRLRAGPHRHRRGGLRPPGQRVVRRAEREGRRLVADRPVLHRRQGEPGPQVLPAPPVGRGDVSQPTDNITVGEASNLGPSNPLLIGFIPGVNTVGLDGKPSKTEPLRHPGRPVLRAGRPTTRPRPRWSPRPPARSTPGTTTAPSSATRTPCPSGPSPTAPSSGWPPDAQVPVDAVTASGSGLDPDISIANADLQAPTVARARHLPLATVQQSDHGQHHGA